MISLPNGNFIVGDITNPRDLYTHNRPYLKDKYKFREVERQLDGKYKPIKEYKRGDLPLELENQVYIKQTGFKNKDDKDMKKRKQYVTGGDIGSGLQKAAPGLAAIPGYGWIAGAAAYGLGSFLKMTEPKEVKYGSPGMTMATGGEINIKPSKRGTFTVAAKNRGKGVQEFASQVLANKENYSPAMVKKANFARNAAK